MIRYGLLMMVVSMFLLVGCDKKMQLTFVNATPEARPVEMTVPGDGTMFVGTMGGMGSRVRKTIKINKDELPAEIEWTAGDVGGRFTVDKHTEDKLTIPVDSKHNLGPIDKNTEIETKDQSETSAEETHTVIE